jgi:membrane glycosyltransferase
MKLDVNRIEQKMKAKNIIIWDEALLNQFKELKRFMLKCTELTIVFIACFALSYLIMSGELYVYSSLIMSLFMIILVGVILVFMTLHALDLSKKLGREAYG